MSSYLRDLFIIVHNCGKSIPKISKMQNTKVSNSPNTSSTKSLHLVVLHHGLWGNRTHVEPIQEELLKVYSESELIFLNIIGSEGNLSYDGVDICGERCTKQLLEFLEHL